MNKAQARIATAKLLAANPNRFVMEAFLDTTASITLDGEHIPAPRWTSKGTYVAYLGGKEVARTEAPQKQDEEPEKPKPIYPVAEEETPETKAFKAEQERLEKLRKGVSTWDRFKDLGVDIVDACQAGPLGSEFGWAWQIPGQFPSLLRPLHPGRHYDVIRRDGYLFRNIPEASITWGAAEPGYEAAEVVRFRVVPRTEQYQLPAGSFMKAERRVFVSPRQMGQF